MRAARRRRFDRYLPHRNYVGEELGNYYQHLFSSSLDAAEAAERRLEETVRGGRAFLELFTNR